MLTMHPRSPLVQGGQEIPIQVTVAVELKASNVHSKKRYLELVNDYDESVHRLFDDVTTSVLKSLAPDESE